MNEIQGELERRLGHLEEALQRSDNAIVELKALLVRAAEALEDEYGAANDPAYGIQGPVHELIAELRKASE